MCVYAQTITQICVLDRGLCGPPPRSASRTFHALLLNPIRKLIGELRVWGFRLESRWLMGLPDLESLIDDSRVLRMAEPHFILPISLIFFTGPGSQAWSLVMQ